MPRTRRQTISQQIPLASTDQLLLKTKPIIKRTKLIKITKKQLRNQIQQKCLRRSMAPFQKQTCISNSQIEQLSNLQKLNCPICLQVFVNPTITECGHNFCLSCIQESLRYKGTCSLCRNSIYLEDFRPSKTLTHLLELKLRKLENPEVLENYKKRVANFDEQERKRKVNPQINIGDLIDYWHQRRWKEGRVIQITSDLQEEKILTIQSFHAYSEVKKLDFKLSSRLIAKHRTYSKQNEGFFRCSPQIRIDIIDIRQTVEQSLLLHAIQLDHWMQRPVREAAEESSESLVRFTFSFERRDM